MPLDANPVFHYRLRHKERFLSIKPLKISGLYSHKPIQDGLHGRVGFRELQVVSPADTMLRTPLGTLAPNQARFQRKLSFGSDEIPGSIADLRNEPDNATLAGV